MWRIRIAIRRESTRSRRGRQSPGSSLSNLKTSGKQCSAQSFECTSNLTRKTRAGDPSSNLNYVALCLALPTSYCRRRAGPHWQLDLEDPRGHRALCQCGARSNWLAGPSEAEVQRLGFKFAAITRAAATRPAAMIFHDCSRANWLRLPEFRPASGPPASSRWRRAGEAVKSDRVGWRGLRI